MTLATIFDNLAKDASGDADRAAARGDTEGAKYAQGLRDAYGTAATFARDAAGSALLAAARQATTPLELLGDYIGNTFDGRVGYAPFDRCAILLELRRAIAAASDDGTCEVCGGPLKAGQGDGNTCGPCTDQPEAKT
jgi:hypothetical protein